MTSNNPYSPYFRYGKSVGDYGEFVQGNTWATGFEGASSSWGGILGLRSPGEVGLPMGRKAERACSRATTAVGRGFCVGGRRLSVRVGRLPEDGYIGFRAPRTRFQVFRRNFGGRYASMSAGTGCTGKAVVGEQYRHPTRVWQNAGRWVRPETKTTLPALE